MLRKGISNQYRSVVASGMLSNHNSINVSSQRNFYHSTVEVKNTEKPAMLCMQCEQTMDHKGCTVIGNCGKTPLVAGMQDLLLEALKGIAQYKVAMGGSRDAKLDKFMVRAMFSTLTNVNFDADRFRQYLTSASAFLEKLAAASGKKLSGPAAWRFDNKRSNDQLSQDGFDVGVYARAQTTDPDVHGLKEMTMYGLKGLAAYAEHASQLGKEDPAVFDFLYHALDQLVKDQTVTSMLNFAMEVGSVNLRVMELLDDGHVSRFGHPVPTTVTTTEKAGKCILITGHDLRDLEALLIATEGKGINIFTHGEMLPAHGYPGLKKYPHLKGNLFGAWQDQKVDFASFPGPIVVTTNCIIEPRKSYKDRIYSMNDVGWPGVTHIGDDRDFSKVIQQALASPGYSRDAPEKSTMTGFARNAVLSNAPAIIDAVKKGDIKHFFLVGGCDGAEGERSYFRDIAKAAPSDSIVMTLACGKYRFNKEFDSFGKIGPFPRMLDVGQCNDAYSAIQIAVGLAKAFNTDVNSLPLSFAISWFEQKAVAVLLTLLSLNVKKIYLGPQPPAFVTPNMYKILQEKFDLRLTGDSKSQIQNMLKNI